MQKRQLSAVIVIALLIASAMVARWLNNKKDTPLLRPKQYIKFTHFGVALPKKYTVQGLDVSKYQGIIKWSWLKEINYEGRGVNFVFIKATQGTTTTDPKFYSNFRQAQQASIPRGAYHFFDPNQDGMAQALHYIKTVKLKKGDLPPVLDIEKRGYKTEAQFHKELRKFLVMVERAYKVKPIIYTYANFYKHHLSDGYNRYPLWIAHYHDGGQPDIDRHWSFWQISESAQASGIIGAVDLNVFNGTVKELERLRIP